SMPSRSATPARNERSTRSARRAICSTISRPWSVATSTAMLSLPWSTLMPATSGNPRSQRIGSPSGGSTLITRAPRSASKVAPNVTVGVEQLLPLGERLAVHRFEHSFPELDTLVDVVEVGCRLPFRVAEHPIEAERAHKRLEEAIGGL